MANIVLFTDPHFGLNLPHARVSADQTTSDRLEDVKAIFRQVDALATEVGAGQIFCLGDLFEKAHPSAPVLIAAAKSMIALTDCDPLGNPTRELFILPGNHDSHGRSGDVYNLDMYTELDVPGVTIMRAGEEILSSDDSVCFHPIPWSPTKKFRARVREASEKAGAGRASFDVLLIHQTVKGCKEGEWVAKRGIDANTFAPFDLTLSGHIHTPQDFPNGRYLGNTMHLRMTDVNSERGAWVIDTLTLKMTFHPFDYPEFVRWHFEDDDCFSVWDRVDNDLPELLDNLDAILLPDGDPGGRDVYIDVKVEGDREGCFDSCTLIRAALDERKATNGGCVRQARVFGLPYNDVKPSERMAIVDSVVKKGEVATPFDLVTAFVKVSKASLPGDVEFDDLVTLGHSILDEVKGEIVDVGGAETELIDLAIEGFGVFKERQTLTLDEVGQVIVLGRNCDTLAADSNGAGKTTMFKALSWVFFEKTIDGLSTDVVNKNSKKAIGSVTLRVDDVRYRVKRERTKATGKLSLERRDGPKWIDESRTRKADTQAAVEALIGLDWDAFRCTVLFGQGDHERFAARGVSDSSRKKILGTVLRNGVYEHARARAVERRRDSSGEAAKHARSSDEVRAKVTAENHAKARISGLLEAVGDLRASGKEKLQKIRARIENECEEASRVRDELARVETETADHEADAAEVKGYLARAREHVDTTNTARREAQRSRDALAIEGPCPECGKPRAYDGEAHSAAKVAYKAARAAHDEARGLAEDFEREMKESKAKLRKCESSKSSLERENIGLEARIKGLRERESSTESEIKNAQTFADEQRGLIDEIDEKVEQFEAQLAGLKKRESAAIVDAACAKWWVTGFGAKGVPSYAIEQALPVLNRHANRHLGTLTDGDIRVRWEATSEGTRGVTREELTMHVVVEGTEAAVPSGGQHKKIELATEIALGDVMKDREGSSVNVMIFDEVFDGLDAAGRSRVLEWLDELNQPSQFVVSHSADVADDFEAILLVTKKSGCATMELYE